MGTLILWGTVHALLALGLGVLSISAVGKPEDALPLLAVAGLLQFVLLVLILSALLPFCAVAARGEPARARHLVQGIKTKWSFVAGLLLIVLSIVVVLGVNFNFYLPLQGTISSPAIKVLLVFIVAVIGWTCLFLYLFMAPWLCAGTADTAKITIRNALKKGLMAVALIPGTWLFLGIIGIALLIGGVYSRVGLVLFIPVMTSLSHTAYMLAAQYADMLALAKEESGESSNLRILKKRAVELGWEWEYAQPKRTFKELIRPWDY